MFDIASSELLLVALVALVVLGPKELPALLRHLGRWTAKARDMRDHLKGGFDEMMRQAETEEAEKAFREAKEAMRRSEELLAAGRAEQASAAGADAQTPVITSTPAIAPTPAIALPADAQPAPHESRPA